MIVRPDIGNIGPTLSRELNIQSPVSIDWYPYTTAKATCRLRKGTYFIRISHFYDDAPIEVIRSLALSVLCRITKKKDSYGGLFRDYLASDRTREKLQSYRKTHGRKIMRGSKGIYHDLDASFDRVNSRYFNDEITGVLFTWGQDSRRTLAHFDASHNTIVVSKKFDQKKVPDFLLDYIVYHELLHFIIPTRIWNGRRIIHPTEFREKEKQFHAYEKSNRLLKTLK